MILLLNLLIIHLGQICNCIFVLAYLVWSYIILKQSLCVKVATISISPNTIALFVILILIALRILIRIQQILVILNIYQFILWQDFSINNIRRIKAQEFSSWLLLEVRK